MNFEVSRYGGGSILISRAYGGGDSFHIYYANYYHGSINQYSGDADGGRHTDRAISKTRFWRVSLNPTSDITPLEIHIILDLITGTENP